MLICNYSYINRVLGKQHSGLTLPNRFIKPEAMRSYYSSDTYVTENISQNKRDSFPTGTNPPYSYVIGDKGALLSSTTTIRGDGTVIAGVSSGINIESSLAGSCSVTSGLSLITALNASLSGLGDLTAALVGSVALNATVSGTSSVSAQLGLISSLVASLSGSGSITASLRGTLSLEADIYVNQSEATVQQIVDGVWNALAAQYNDPNTMGELLNGAGGGSSPGAVASAVWDELLSGHTITGSAADELKKKLSQVMFLALK